jgi:hypothetical protein
MKWLWIKYVLLLQTKPLQPSVLSAKKTTSESYVLHNFSLNVHGAVFPDLFPTERYS